MFSKWSSYFFGNNDDATDDVTKDVLDNGPIMNEPEQQQKPIVVASGVKKSKKKDNHQQKKKKNGALNKKSVVSAAAVKNYKTVADTSAIEVKSAAAVSSADEEDWILLDDQKTGTVPSTGNDDSGFEMSSNTAGTVEQEEQEEMVILEAEKNDDDAGGDYDDNEEVSIVDMSDVYKDDEEEEDPELISLDLSSATEADESWCVEQVPMSLSPITTLNNNFIPSSKQFEMDAFNLVSFGTLPSPSTSMSFYNTNFMFFKNCDFKENCEPRSIIAAALNDLEVSLPSKHKKISSANVVDDCGAAAVADDADDDDDIATSVVALKKDVLKAAKLPKTKAMKKRNRDARLLNVVVPDTKLVPNTNHIDRLDLLDKNPRIIFSGKQIRTNKRKKTRALAYQGRECERSLHFLMFDNY